MVVDGGGGGWVVKFSWKREVMCVGLIMMKMERAKSKVFISLYITTNNSRLSQPKIYVGTKSPHQSREDGAGKVRVKPLGPVGATSGWQGASH